MQELMKKLTVQVSETGVTETVAEGRWPQFEANLSKAQQDARVVAGGNVGKCSKTISEFLRSKTQ